MKQLIQNLGLVIFIIAIAILVYGLLGEQSDNNILLLSGGLIIIGLVIHVILNKKFI